MPTDEDDTGIIGYAFVQLQNERLFESLATEHQEWLVGMVDRAMAYMVDERAESLPHHGSALMIAQLNKAGHLSDAALALACVLTTAMERWERDHAGRG
jgi:hypothetical protein